MKKIVSVLLSLMLIICIAFALTGCDGKTTEENKKLAEENAQLVEENKKLAEENAQLVEENKKLAEENARLIEENKQLVENNKVQTGSGKFCTLQVGYENGLLTQNDLKSIACQYYEVRNYEENPYSGMFDPHKELSQATENEIKQAYLNQIAKYPEGALDNVTITCYYGTYNGNVVVGINSGYICIEPPDAIPNQTEIGGVIFKKFFDIEIRVYQI